MQNIGSPPQLASVVQGAPTTLVNMAWGGGMLELPAVLLLLLPPFDEEELLPPEPPLAEPTPQLHSP